jgi:hypothetical protein
MRAPERALLILVSRSNEKQLNLDPASNQPVDDEPIAIIKWVPHNSSPFVPT